MSNLLLGDKRNMSIERKTTLNFYNTLKYLKFITYVVQRVKEREREYND